MAFLHKTVIYFFIYKTKQVMKTLLISTALLAGIIKPNTNLVTPTTTPNPIVSEMTFATTSDYQIKTADGATITLRAGTPIVVESSQTYNAKNLSEGQTVNVRVKYNVISNKQTLVAAGALGTATISDLTKPGVFGKAGRIELQIQSVQAVDGQQILLSGIAMTAEGQNKKGLAWGLSIGLFLFTFIGGVIGLFIKGKPAEIKSGTTANASVASDAQIDVTESTSDVNTPNGNSGRNMSKRN
jgi:hypothetical protein